jgi:uncharacterized membrane protein
VNISQPIDENTQSSLFLVVVFRLRTLFSIVIGIVFLMSSIPHLLNQYDFLDSVLKYKLLPFRAAELIAAYLPWMQVTIAACLFFAVFRRAAWSVSLALFLAFFAAQISLLVRGLKINCGCFGTSDNPISVVSASLVFGFFLISLAGYVSESQKCSQRDETASQNRG